MYATISSVASTADTIAVASLNATLQSASLAMGLVGMTRDVSDPVGTILSFLSSPVLIGGINNNIDEKTSQAGIGNKYLASYE